MVADNGYIEEVKSIFEKLRAELHHLGSKSIKNTDFFLSRFLFTVASLGSTLDKKSLVCTGLALEFLDQAFRQGVVIQRSPDFANEWLLLNDYFYAKAIKLVADLNKPAIIEILSWAVHQTALERVQKRRVCNSYCYWLVFASSKLGFQLGQLNSRFAPIFFQTAVVNDPNKVYIKLADCGVSKATIDQFKQLVSEYRLKCHEEITYI